MLLTLLAGLAIAGCGGTTGTSTNGRRGEPPPELPARFFAPDSVWNTPLPTDASLDPDSNVLSSALARQAEEIGSMVNTDRYSTPIYTVAADQPGVRVQINGADPALQRAVSEVPLPSGAQPAVGTDRHLVVWQPSTDTMWEFWRLRRQNGRWFAGHGGRITDVQKSPGYYRDRRSPDGKIIEERSWGATATSLPLAAGTITTTELRSGRIDHALALGVPEVRAGVVAFPAQRSDGRYSGSEAIPEGARFRLDPSVHVASLGLPPGLRAIATAAQRYGMIVRDGSSAVSLYTQDPTPTGTDPYPALFSGLRPYKFAALFPWDRLQLTEMHLRPAPR
ncbi:MAG: hypothetical protein ACJ75T_00940 [Solirubrobacterales bacterium]